MFTNIIFSLPFIFQGKIFTGINYERIYGPYGGNQFVQFFGLEGGLRTREIGGFVKGYYSKIPWRDASFINAAIEPEIRISPSHLPQELYFGIGVIFHYLYVNYKGYKSKRESVQYELHTGILLQSLISIELGFSNVHRADGDNSYMEFDIEKNKKLILLIPGWERWSLSIGLNLFI